MPLLKAFWAAAVPATSKAFMSSRSFLGMVFLPTTPKSELGVAASIPLPAARAFMDFWSLLARMYPATSKPAPPRAAVLAAIPQLAPPPLPPTPAFPPTPISPATLPNSLLPTDRALRAPAAMTRAVTDLTMVLTCPWSKLARALLNEPIHSVTFLPMMGALLTLPPNSA